MSLNKNKKYMEDEFDLETFQKEAEHQTRRKNTSLKNNKIIKVSTFFIVILAFAVAYLLYSILDYFIISLF